MLVVLEVLIVTKDVEKQHPDWHHQPHERYPHNNKWNPYMPLADFKAHQPQKQCPHNDLLCQDCGSLHRWIRQWLALTLHDSLCCNCLTSKRFRDGTHEQSQLGYIGVGTVM
jgi:hypothetical protein